MPYLWTDQDTPTKTQLGAKLHGQLTGELYEAVLAAAYLAHDMPCAALDDHFARKVEEAEARFRDVLATLQQMTTAPRSRR